MNEDTPKYYGLIYKVTNLITNKYYIGQTTKNLGTRISQHKAQIKNPKYKLHFSMRKYGIENFIFEEICYCKDKEELDKMEIYFIAEYDSVKNGYNQTYGGNSKGKYTEETKLKISIANKGKLAGYKNPMYGKTHEGEALEKIAKASIGRINGEKNPKAKITMQIVSIIRENKEQLSRKELSDKYGVNTGTIGKIINNKIWIV